jgi:hypothetical protein
VFEGGAGVRGLCQEAAYNIRGLDFYNIIGIRNIHIYIYIYIAMNMANFQASRLSLPRHLSCDLTQGFCFF